MNISDAYKKLNEWLDNSNGNPINIGDGIYYSFKRKKKYELEDFENNFEGYSSDYIDFLINVGEVDLFIDDTLGIEFLAFEDRVKFENEVFSDPLYSEYPDILICVSIPKVGYVGGFSHQNNKGANFGIFFPEVPLDLWLKETDFISFNEWVIFLVDTKNQEGIEF